LKDWTSIADADKCAATSEPSTAAESGSRDAVEIEAVASAKKYAGRQERVIIFVDESGLSERPCRARTWSPRRQKPILQCSFTWKLLSVIVGLSFRRFYFRLFPGTIKCLQVVELLKALQAHIGRKLLIVWDRFTAYRSRLGRDCVESQHGSIQLEYLPAYASELKPVEHIWGHLKSHEVANFCPVNFTELNQFARCRPQSMQRRPTLVTAFRQEAELFLYVTQLWKSQ
jgi:transposase